MNKEFIDWFISVFGTEFHISTEQQRQNLIEHGQAGLDSSTGGCGSNDVLRGAWAAWQALQPQWQPIKTVPMDEKVLILDDDGDMVVGFIYSPSGWCSHGSFDPVKWQPLPEVVTNG